MVCNVTKCRTNHDALLVRTGVREFFEGDREGLYRWIDKVTRDILTRMPRLPPGTSFDQVMYRRNTLSGLLYMAILPCETQLALMHKQAMHENIPFSKGAAECTLAAFADGCRALRQAFPGEFWRLWRDPAQIRSTIHVFESATAPRA